MSACVSLGINAQTALIILSEHNYHVMSVFGLLQHFIGFKIGLRPYK